MLTPDTPYRGTQFCQLPPDPTPQGGVRFGAQGNVRQFGGFRLHFAFRRFLEILEGSLPCFQPAFREWGEAYGQAEKPSARQSFRNTIWTDFSLLIIGEILAALGGVYVAFGIGAAGAALVLIPLWIWLGRYWKK